MKKKSIVIVICCFVLIALLTMAFGNSSKSSKKSAGKIGVIYVDGLIIGGRAQSVLNDYNGTDSIMKQLRAAKDDDTIKAVVIRINSPGGSAPASQEVAEEVKKLRSTGKPVISSMGDVAASGGYWLAAVTDKIYANPATLTGSIGVYMPYANWQELYKKIGISNEKIKSGPHKDILSPERSMTNEERAIIQVMVDDMYEQFVQVVAEGRKMDIKQVKQLADGRIYTGNQAKALGLVDELGNFYDAVDGAAQMAGIVGKPEIKEFGQGSPFSMLFGPSEKIDIQQVFEKKIINKFMLTLPMVIPEQW